MSEQNRKIDTYTVKQSIYIGDKEVVLSVDKSQEFPFMVCYCDYNNPFSAPMPVDAAVTADYLEAVQYFTECVQAQVKSTRDAQKQFGHDTPFTLADCIPDKRDKSIVGKVVVVNAEQNRYEYQKASHQLILAESGSGASGGRGNAVYGTLLSDGQKARWERYQILGELKPECMPAWAKEALAKIKAQEKNRKPHSREER